MSNKIPLRVSSGLSDLVEIVDGAEGVTIKQRTNELAAFLHSRIAGAVNDEYASRVASKLNNVSVHAVRLAMFDVNSEADQALCTCISCARRESSSIYSLCDYCENEAQDLAHEMQAADPGVLDRALEIAGVKK